MAVRIGDRAALRVAKFAPTKRALATLRTLGYKADIAERRTGPITRDLFGIVDIVAVHPTARFGRPALNLPTVLLVQVTSRAHVSDRVAKILAHPVTRALLDSQVAIQVWGFSPDRPDPRVVNICLKGLSTVSAADVTFPGQNP